jgi:hypothetical protein
MILAKIHEHGKRLIKRDYKYLSVRDIHSDMRAAYGRAHFNETTISNGKVLVTWQFDKAKVVLEGEVGIRMGYSTIRNK